MVEYFSGNAQVSDAFREAGYAVASYDYLYTKRGMDFLSAGGFGSDSQVPKNWNGKEVKVHLSKCL